MKNNMIRAASALLLTFAASLLSSCATTKSTVSTARNLSSVYVTNTNTIKVLSPEYMDAEIDCVYVFSADFGEQNLSTLSYLYSDSEGMEMLLLSDFGIEIGHLNYDGKSVDLALPVKAPIKGEYIVADLQNIFYPEQCLAENYASAGLTFKSTTLEDGSVIRTVSKKDRTVEKITMKLNEDGNPESVVLENLLRGYTYRLTLADE